MKIVFASLFPALVLAAGFSLAACRTVPAVDPGPPFVYLPALDEALLGGYVLMVERTATPQWEGVRLNREFLDTILTPGETYYISVDIFTPRSVGGVGLMIQTHGDPWTHMMFTPNFNADPAVQPRQWTRFDQTLDWSAPGNPMPSRVNPFSFPGGVASYIGLVGRGGETGGIGHSSPSITFIDNFKITRASDGEIVWLADFEDGSLHNLIPHLTVNVSIVPAAMAHAYVWIGPEARYWDLTLPSLVETFGDHFLIGNIWGSNWREPTLAYANTEAFFLRNFNAITAEDYHKPDQVTAGFRQMHPANFARGVGVVEWAMANNVTMIGHALVWHSQTPLWFTGQAGNAASPLVTREEAMENMRWFISSWAGYFEGRADLHIDTWDVLNEVFFDYISWDDWLANPDWRAHIRRGPGAGLNQPGYVQWYNAFANNTQGLPGEDFIWYAFYFARQYAPSSTLYYNDFNEEVPGKREAIVQMVNYINGRWGNSDGRLLIEGIGMQSHHHIEGWATNFDNIPAAIQAFAATGARVSITELDITYGGFGSPAIPDAQWTAAHLERQAEVFARVMGYYLRYSHLIHRVSMWGLSDPSSWRAAGRPLLFDGSFDPKPAFWAFVGATAD